ncbi:MAG TPA: hypothetical protein VKH63_21995 [Candidatus Acidoferrum sp.]|jgi:hypothetical protein|nr:hypothetical protein [Candidatus Acidoferrum sp.]
MKPIAAPILGGMVISITRMNTDDDERRKVHGKELISEIWDDKEVPANEKPSRGFCTGIIAAGSDYQ